jgi:HTH-type transcriptional regulator/antitoxin HigA
MKSQSIMSKKNKIAAHDLVAGDVFHPGVFLKEEIDARAMKQVQLAEAIGLSKTEVSLIIHGKRNITVAIAIKLEDLLNIDAETWMNMQVKYEIELMKISLQRPRSLGPARLIRNKKAQPKIHSK